MKIVFAFLIAIFLLIGCGVLQESGNPTGNVTETKNEVIPEIEKEKADTNSNTNLLDSIPEIDHELMSEKQIANDWVYFLYPNLEYPTEDAHELYRWREDETDLTRISSIRCDSYTVLDENVYFADYTMMGAEHGILYVIRPNQEPEILAEELCFYQIVDTYIYYALSYDTIGVGIEGHALHRIDLDGGNHMIAAYEVGSPDLISKGHIGYVEDGYIDYGNYRVKLGEPADGTEEVLVFTSVNSNDGWIYYSTNRLIKAQPDGSQQTILDGDESSWIYIDRIDDEWIYYTDYNPMVGYLKIRKDGSEKTEIDAAEFNDMEDDNNTKG